MGPSGCGKTTLLNVLSGIDEPNSGTVMINGENLYGSSDDERTRVRGKHMGFIFQEFNLLPVMTALENVELPLLIQGTPANEARIEATKALTAVGLGDRLEHRPAELSGGQQRRLRLLGPSCTGLQLCSVTSQLGIWMLKLQHPSFNSSVRCAE